MEPMTIFAALAVIAFLILCTWIAWTYIPWEWAKYFFGGALAIVTVYKFIMFVLYIL